MRPLSRRIDPLTRLALFLLAVLCVPLLVGLGLGWLLWHC